MTKKTLLVKLHDNTVTDEVCRNIIVRIKDTLLAFDDDAEIENFTSLTEFFDNGGFSQTKINADSQPRDIETIRKELEIILKELQTWVNREKQRRDVAAVGNDWLCGQQHKNFIASVIFIAVFAAFAVAVFVFSILDNCNVFKTSGVASGICGSLDFLCGVSFFVYEWFSDKKVKTMRNEMGAVSGVVYYKSKIKVKGNNNNFGIRNGNTSDDVEKRARDFIVKYGKSKFQVKGDNNNFGDRG